MGLEIGSSLQGGPAVQAENSIEQLRSERVSESAPEGQRPPEDSVTVSQDARLLAEASRTAQNTPDVRRERVEALRIQVQNGTYKPDSSLIASSLIREEPGLFLL